MPNDQSIICPYCQREIALTEAIAGPIRSRLKQELESGVKNKEKELAQREENLQKTKQELEKEKGQIDELVEKKLSEERITLKRKGKEEAQKEFSIELEDLKRQNTEKEEAINEAKRNELAFRKERQVLEQKIKNVDLEVARKVDEERNKIAKATEGKIIEQHKFEDLKKEKLINDMKKQIEELRRKAEQGSQQTQGEIPELEVEEGLRIRFPLDQINPIPKGANGADILQKVHNRFGHHCGTLIIEIKYTKNWKNDWIEKLKDDQIKAKAEIAILITSALPDDISNFSNINEVWVTNFSSAMDLISVLRTKVVEISNLKQSSVGKNEKMELVYNYLSGSEFKQRVQAIVETFTSMKGQLDQEKRAMQRIWKAREKQINRVVNNTSEMYGDLQGIIGASLPQIESLELKALPESEEEDEVLEDNEDMPF